MVEHDIKQALTKSFGRSISKGKSPYFKIPKQPRKTIGFDWDRGAWNNIRMGMEVMTCLAKIFDRALVIPEPAQWLLLTEKAHMFDFYDQETFTSYVPVSKKPKKGKMYTFSKDQAICNWGRIEVNELKKYDTYDHWFFPEDARMFGYFPLSFANPGPLFPLIKSAFRFNDSLIEKATKKLEDNNLALGEYVALHVRRNDFQFRKVTNRPAQDIIEYVSKNIPQHIPILILTDQYDAKLIQLFESLGHRVVCWGQKKGREKVTLTESKESIVIDMLCGVPALKFFGSQRSTFSTYIVHMRGMLHNIYSHIDPSILFTCPQKSGSDVSWWSYIDENYWETNPFKRFGNWRRRREKRNSIEQGRLKHEQNMARRAQQEK